MMIKRKTILYVLLFTLLSTAQPIKAQKADIITSTSLVPQPQQVAKEDTLPKIQVSESDLDNLSNIKAQLQKQNESYTTPVQPDSNLLQVIEKEESGLSDEALYWARLVRDASTQFGEYVTFRDTIIVDPLYMPLLFRGDYLPNDLTFYDFYWNNPQDAYSKLYKPDSSLFQQEIKKQQFRDMAYKYVERTHPNYFKYSKRDLPTDIPKSHVIRSNPFAELFNVTNEADFDAVSGPGKFAPKIKYWRPAFESAIQFSQNYISENWHKGGTGNINLFTRNYFKYDYNREKIQITNELEWKASVFTAPKDTVHEYKIGDDVFRIHSNVGYKAFSKWYYTFDAEFKTQFFTNYAENSQNKLAAFLSPMSINLGLGMKYELKKENFKDKHKKLFFSINLAPLSYTYMYSVNEKIDLARHGFKDNKHYMSNLGSSIKADVTFNINRNITWQSRLNYFTSYSRIDAELENTLNLAISRFFSTRLYLDLRYDDSVKKKKDSDSLLQINELISFGFNYKW